VARLILDTTVLVTAERSARRINRVIADGDDVAIAAVTVAELLVGVELADDDRREQRAQFVRDILDAVPVEDYDLAVATEHARLLAHVRRTGKPRGAHDLIIAATAVARDRVVISADTHAFTDLPGVRTR
jgi:tRNA(fMet)-specific endonuclease VapC